MPSDSGKDRTAAGHGARRRLSLQQTHFTPLVAPCYLLAASLPTPARYPPTSVLRTHCSHSPTLPGAQVHG